MDDELKLRLGKYLEVMEQAVKDGSDFVVEQAPLYVQEFLAWEFWGNMISAVGLLVPCVVIVLAMKQFWAWTAGDGDEEARAFLGVPLVILFVLLYGVLYYTKQAVKVKIAPRVVIVDALRDSVK